MVSLPVQPCERESKFNYYYFSGDFCLSVSVGFDWGLQQEEGSQRKITYLVRQVAGFDGVDGCSGSLREAMSASGFVAGLIIHTKVATTRADGDRDLWVGSMWLASLFKPFFFPTQHCEWNEGTAHYSGVMKRKACFTWRGEDGWTMITLMGFLL